MQLSFDILDHIFSFVSDRRILAICSKDPILSPIVERHCYYHVIVRIKDGRWIDPLDLEFEPNQLVKLVSENPHIRNYVRVLQIESDYHHSEPPPQKDMKQWDVFAETLLTFPILESIMFTTEFLPHWPAAFRAALEDRLKLPTVKEVHVRGHYGPFPFSLLSNCGNIKNLSLSGSFLSKDQVNISTFFQLKSLALLGHFSSSPLLAWIKLQISLSKLQSLKLWQGDIGLLSELLGLCSRTLKTLDIHVKYNVNPTFGTAKLSSISPNLQQLTIHVSVSVHIFDKVEIDSDLSAAALIIDSFIPSSSLRHLILDVEIRLGELVWDIDDIDFSFLDILGIAAQSIPRIDLYVYSHSADIPYRELWSSLVEGHEAMMRAIKDGILVIHAAPYYK